MNIIDTSNITDPAQQQPFTGPSLQFLQASTKEMLASIVQNQIGNTITPNIPYALYGCIQSGSNPYNFSQGYIYYNGEIYLFPAIGPINITTGNPLCTITSTNNYIDPNTLAPIDPLIFSNLAPFYVHDVRTIVLSNGVPVTSNTATQFNFNSIVYLIPQPKVRLSAPINQTFAPFAPFGATPNPLTMASFTTPNDGLNHTYQLILQAGVKMAGHTFSGGIWADYTFNIIVGGTIQATLNPRFPTPDSTTVGYSGYGLNDGVVTLVQTIGPGVLIEAIASPGQVFNGNMYLEPAGSFGGPAGWFTCFEL